MSKKIIASLLLGSLLLSSCGTVVPIEQEANAKKPFFVDTKLAKDFNREYTLEKSGRLVGSSTISLASQGVGRVSSVVVKEGASVKKWQTLVLLKDTTANYDIRLSQAQNALKNAEVSAESTRLGLDKAVSDAKFALYKAQIDYTSLENDSLKKLEKANRDAEKSVISTTGSEARIALEKAELDYENLKSSNIQTIKNFDATYKLSLNDLKKLLAKLLYQGDKSFGITDKFRNETVTVRQYMGARDSSTRTKLEVAYNELLQASTELEVASIVSVDESNILSNLEKLGGYYGLIRNYILVTNAYIENSIPSSSFAQTTIDGYVAEYLGYKSELAILESTYTTFKNSTSTFLANYKNNEASMAAGLEVQKKNLSTLEFESALGLDRTKISVDRDIAQAKIVLESAEANYQNSVSNKDITLRKLEVSLTDARLALEQAEKEFSKLSIVAPIDATITRVHVSVGQEVSLGTPMVEISSQNPEIIFDLDSVSVGLLKIGSVERVFYDGETYSGTVVGISQVADSSLLYTARITLSESPKYLGGVATIKLSLETDSVLLPNEVIKVVSEGEGEIFVLSGSTLVPMNVKLGTVIGRSIEVRTQLPDNLEIITSDVSNFDERKNVIEKRKTGE